LRLIKVTAETGVIVYIDAEKVVEILAGSNGFGRIGTYITVAGSVRSRWVVEDIETVKKLLEEKKND
jgi:hypothetical protein